MAVTAAVLLSLSIAQPATARAASSCGDLLIVLDRSGSIHDWLIGGQPKEVIAKAALKAVIGRYPTLPMGLAVFPGTACVAWTPRDPCECGRVVVDLVAERSPRLREKRVASTCDREPA